ncbi:hermansky-pudlak syndrome 5 protein homolog [Plakobranchus ocellatus]|uniref:Hermansky-pudlak syndrome 5 protein homolog n=1 Tax=Plakobranchus ocellatus TaxID=259542 RepID=A0AAV3ZPT8_9GAST|nr:hermansky-pudlak syndrome 5 protein homolog [Plakobranchus ocellatus]
MSKPGGSAGLTHIFSELTSQDELNVPLGRSARLRYTCLSVCGKYVALGSNSGGTYIFSRDTLKYLQVVFSDTNAIPVDLVSLSPSDQLIGLGLSNGQISVFELNIEKRSKPERIRHTLDHSGHGITVMTWDSTSSKLYVGDDAGKISVISVPSRKTKTLFAAPSQVIALLDSAIYQLQWWKEKLLVSTVTHSHLFNTSKHTYSTIGTKPRAGEFGSCFFLEPNSQVPVIYCARPGSRMWEVSFEGKVLNTHQFKHLLAVPPVPVVRSRGETFEFANDVPYQAQSTNFLKMFSMGHFIITWSSKGLYMFDPINVKLAMWTQSIKGIKDVCVYRNDVYLFLENTTVRRLTILPIYQLFTVLASRGRWTLLAQMLLSADKVNFRLAALKKVKRDLLCSIYQGLKQGGEDQLLERVRASMEDVSEGSIDSLGTDSTEDFLDSLELKGYIFLSSGMVVREGLGAEGGVRSTDGSHIQRYIPEGFHRSSSDESVYKEDMAWERKEASEEEETSSADKVVKNHSASQQSSEAEDENCQQSLHKPSLSGEKGGGEERDGQWKGEENHLSAKNSHGKGHEKNMKEFEAAVSTESGSQSSDNFVEGECDLLDVNGDPRMKESYAGTDFDSSILERASNPHLQTLKSLENKEKVENYSHLPNRRVEIKEDCQVELQSVVSQNGGRGKPMTSTSFENHYPSSENMISKESDSNLLPSDTVLESISSVPSTDSFTKNPIAGKDFHLKDSNIGLISSGQKDAIEDFNQIKKARSLMESFASSVATIEDHHTEQLTESENVGQRISITIASADLTASASSTSSTPQENMYSSHSDSNDMPSLEEKSLLINELTDSVKYKAVAAETENLLSKTSSGSESLFGPEDSLKPAAQSKQLTRFASVPALSKDDEAIAKPQRQSRKKSRSKKSANSTSNFSSISGKLSRSASVGSVTEMFSKQEADPDTVSIGTISSIEEEEEFSMRKVHQDFHSTTEGTRESPDTGMLSHILASPAKSSATAFPTEERRHSETIPPLVDRLAAARSSMDFEDSLDQHRSNSLTSSGEHALSGSPRGSLSVLKDELSLKLKNQTKSFLRSLKENNILPRPGSLSKSDAQIDQQKSRSPPQPINNFESSSSNQSRSSDCALEGGEVGDKSTVDEVEEELVHMDCSHLCSIASEIKRKLLTSSKALLDPKELQALLARWSREIIIAVGHCCLEIESKRRQASYPQDRSEHVETPQDQVDELLSQNQVNHNPTSREDLGNKLITAVEDDASSLQTSGTFSTTNIKTNCVSPYDVASDCSSSQSQCPSHKLSQPPDINWWSFVHAKSPFSISSENLELFQWLTTRCWLCGVTGNILTTLDRLSSKSDSINLDSPKEGEPYIDHVQTDKMKTNLLDASFENVGGILKTEQSVISLFRTLLPSNVFEIFMKSKETTPPSLLSLVSDAFLPENGVNGDRSVSHSCNSYHSNTPHSLSSSSISSDVSESIHMDNGKLKHRQNGVDLKKHGCLSHEYSNFQCDSNDRRESVNKVDGHKHLTASHCVGLHHPSSDQTVPSQGAPWWCSSALRKDASLALFTRMLFFLLDYEQIKAALEDSRKTNGSFLLTWISLIDCSAAKGHGDIVSGILADRVVKSAVDYLRSGILPHRSAMMGHLLELFKQAPLMASDFCGELKKTVSPLDLVGMCILTGKPALIHLLRYFKQAMLDTATYFRPQRFEELVSQPEVRYLLLQAQLPALVRTDKTDVAMHPNFALASELENILPSNWVGILLAKIDSDDERENVFWLCSTIKYFKICIQLLTQKNQWRRLLQWIVQQDDIRLLKSQHCYSEAYLPKNIKEWTYLLNCMKETQRKRQCGSLESVKRHSSTVGEDLRFSCDDFSQTLDDKTVERMAKQEMKHHAHSDSASLSGEAFKEGKEKRANLFVHSTSDTDTSKSISNLDSESHSEGQDNSLKVTATPALYCDLSSVECVNGLSLSNGDRDLSPRNSCEEEIPWSLTWSSVGYLLLEHLGGAAAINLLVGHMIEEDDDPSQAWSGLGSDFIQACYTNFLIEGQKDQVSHEMLERMSVFMWAKKPGFVSPLVYHAYKAEYNVVEKRQGEETDVQRVFGQVKSLSNQALKSEDLGGHWGVSTDVSQRCGVCNIPLRTIMSLSVQGAIVFPCGHAYHRCCMSASACPQMH